MEQFQLSDVLLKKIADLISVPFFVRTKSWDVVIMLGFLLVISFTKLSGVSNEIL